MRRIVLLLFLATALVSAGCLGGSPSSSVQTQSTDGTQAATSSANSTMNHTQQPTYAWNHTTKSGTVTAGSVPFVGTLSFGGDISQNWTVAAGATNLTLNLSAQGGDLQANIYPPGCKPSSTGITPSCAYQVNTTNGVFAWGIANPGAGKWQIDLFPTGAGYDSVSYKLDIGILAPVMSS